MNNAEPIPDPILLLKPASESICRLCNKPVIGEKFWVPRYRCAHEPYCLACEECYAAYVKTKFGSGNTNPDDIQII